MIRITVVWLLIAFAQGKESVLVGWYYTKADCEQAKEKYEDLKRYQMKCFLAEVDDV